MSFLFSFDAMLFESMDIAFNSDGGLQERLESLGAVEADGAAERK